MVPVSSIPRRFKQAAQTVLADQPYTLLDLAAVKTGRLLFAVAYIRPDAGITVHDLDRLRRVIQADCENVFAAVKTEIIFTGNRPFDEGSSIRSEAGIR